MLIGFTPYAGTIRAGRMAVWWPIAQARRCRTPFFTCSHGDDLRESGDPVYAGMIVGKFPWRRSSVNITKEKKQNQYARRRL